MDVSRVEVNALRASVDPFSLIEERYGYSIDAEAVKACLDSGNEELSYLNRHETRDVSPEYLAREREKRVRKIAYFVRYGFSEPINLEIVGSDMLLTDGVNRFCASLIRQDKQVRAYLQWNFDLSLLTQEPTTVSTA